MIDPTKAMRDIATLAAEGARRFGDDPKAIIAFIEAEIAKLSEDERKAIDQGLRLVAEGPTGIASSTH